MTKKNTATIKELVEEFPKHSREYHNTREDAIRGYGNGGNKNIAVVLAKLENMDQGMTKLDQSIHAIRVGCENFNGPHLTKDCYFYELEIKKIKCVIQVVII